MEIDGNGARNVAADIERELRAIASTSWTARQVRAGAPEPHRPVARHAMIGDFSIRLFLAAVVTTMLAVFTISYATVHGV